jgi:transcription elongation factor Elf1
VGHRTGALTDGLPDHRVLQGPPAKMAVRIGFTMVDYRNKARHYARAAKVELESGDDARLRYAALDLRLVIEALTYDRATAYKEELPPKEYETWQPKKLMAVLLEIDPTADKDSTIRVGVEETYGVPASVMENLGTDTVFNLPLLKKHYDALGNYLHVPSLKQAQGAPPSMEKLRQRCTDISGYIEKVLSSPVWNSTLGDFATFECHLCGAPIRKRLPHGISDVTAECFECLASYKVKDIGDGKIDAVAEITQIPCANPDCGHLFEIFRREMTLNTSWNCPKCDGQNVLGLSVRYNPPGAPKTSA